MSRIAAQIIADQIRNKVEGQTGILPQFVVENHKVQKLHGIYTLLKVNVGSGRFVHVEVYQSSPVDPPQMTGLERDCSASHPLDNIASVSDH